MDTTSSNPEYHITHMVSVFRPNAEFALPFKVTYGMVMLNASKFMDFYRDEVQRLASLYNIKPPFDVFISPEKLAPYVQGPIGEINVPATFHIEDIEDIEGYHIIGYSFDIHLIPWMTGVLFLEQKKQLD